MIPLLFVLKREMAVSLGEIRHSTNFPNLKVCGLISEHPNNPVSKVSGNRGLGVRGLNRSKKRQHDQAFANGSLGLNFSAT
jgi:hypothetical protein